MKRRIVTATGLCLLVVVVMILLGMITDKPERVQSTYTVRPGDRLYDIAAELGVSDWREWCYEVCRMNGIEDGGTIYPGDEIIIYTEVN